MPAQQPGRSTQNYQTPACFIQAVTRRLDIDVFTVDLAADVHNTQAPVWVDEQTNALSLAACMWAAHIGVGWGWLNPPYARIAPWAARGLHTGQAGGKLAFLVPASVGSNWFRDCIHGQPGVSTLFLNGRIPFIPDKPTWLYPKDCMLVLFQGTAEPYKSDVWTWRS
jgi:hypothetical protein